MKPVVDNSPYRVQAVDLQPHGNTISVECPSDNPFEDAQDVEITTQSNGDASLAGPDPRMKSKRILTKGKRLPTLHAGKAAVRQLSAPAHVRLQHNGFIPGLGSFTTMAQRAQAFRARQAAIHQHAVHAATMMGLGSITAGKGAMRRFPVPRLSGRPQQPMPRAGGAHPAHYARFIPGMGGLGVEAAPSFVLQNPYAAPSTQGASYAGTPPAASPDYASALTALANAASAPITTAQQAHLTQAQAQLQDATARNTAASTEHSAFLASLTKSSSMPWIIGGGLAVVAAIYFLSKPRKAKKAA